VTKKVLSLGQNRITFQIWDIVGSIEYSDLQSQYLRGSEGAFLVCDLTRPETVDNVAHWRERIEQAAPGATLVILGNKIDLVPQGFATTKEVKSISGNLGLPFLTTSAKTGENVEEAFRSIGQTLLDKFNKR
jgi:small GTP-binding protein